MQGALAVPSEVKDASKGDWEDLITQFIWPVSPYEFTPSDYFDQEFYNAHPEVCPSFEGTMAWVCSPFG